MPAESWLYILGCIILQRTTKGTQYFYYYSTLLANYSKCRFWTVVWQWDFWGDFQTHFELLPDFEKLGMQYSQDAFLFFLRQIIMQLGIAGLGLLQSSRRSHEFPLMTAPCRYLLATTLPKFLISCQFWAAAAKLELIFQFPYWRAAMQSSPKIRHHQLQKREEKT